MLHVWLRAPADLRVLCGFGPMLWTRHQGGFTPPLTAFFSQYIVWAHQQGVWTWRSKLAGNSGRTHNVFLDVVPAQRHCSTEGPQTTCQRAEQFFLSWKYFHFVAFPPRLVLNWNFRFTLEQSQSGASSFSWQEKVCFASCGTFLRPLLRPLDWKVHGK